MEVPVCDGRSREAKLRGGSVPVTIGGSRQWKTHTRIEDPAVLLVRESFGPGRIMLAEPEGWAAKGELLGRRVQRPVGRHTVMDLPT